jgi:hypothetical protein
VDETVDAAEFQIALKHQPHWSLFLRRPAIRFLRKQPRNSARTTASSMRRSKDHCYAGKSEPLFNFVDGDMPIN